MTDVQRITQVPLWRKLLAGAAGLVSAVYFVVEVGDMRDLALLAVPVGGPLVAAMLVHRPTLGPQLVARAVWWSSLALGVLLCVVGSGSDSRLGFAMTLACGAALLIIGRKGLAEASERAAFMPAAFRSSLLLLMVLAVADAQSLALFAVVDHNKDSGRALVPLVVSAIAFTAGFIGLYRLALWGAFLNFAVALALFLVTASGAIRLTSHLDVMISMLMGVHVLVAAPVIVGVLRQKPLPSLPQPVRAVLAPVAIAILMVIGISAKLYHFGW